MKLIPMTDFVLEQINPSTEHPQTHLEDSQTYLRIFEYAKFLKQPLTLGMFVPCDKKGNVYVDYKTYQPKKGTICIPYEGLFEVSRKGKGVELLNEPQFWKDDQRYYNKRKYEEALKEYQEAKERVLFEVQYKSDTNEIWLPNSGKLSTMCVEDLIILNFKLTESAKQKLGL